MDESRLKGIEDRASKATPGPWFHDSSNSWSNGGIYTEIDPDGIGVEGREVLAVHDDWMRGEAADGEFLAASRTDIPDLCRALREAWAEIDAIHRDLDDAKVDRTVLTDPHDRPATLRERVLFLRLRASGLFETVAMQNADIERLNRALNACAPAIKLD